jgi:hypothetical protein
MLPALAVEMIVCNNFLAAAILGGVLLLEACCCGSSAKVCCVFLQRIFARIPIVLIPLLTFVVIRVVLTRLCRCSVSVSVEVRSRVYPYVTS